MSFGNLISDRHKRASRMLGFCLTDGTLDCWASGSLVWCARLSDGERILVSWSFLRTLPPEVAVRTLEAAHLETECPLPNLISPEDEAAFWAFWADYADVKACTLAGFNRLSSSDQLGLLKHVRRRTAA